MIINKIMRMRILLAIVLAHATTLSALAYDFMVDGLCYNKNEDGTTVTVTSQNNSYPRYTSLSGELTIPESVTYNGNTYSVTSIDGAAFMSCSNLTSVIIGNSVKSIGFLAFSNCSSLASLVVGNSVNTIGNEAFGCCSSLKSILVETGNTTYDSRENCNAIIETFTNTLIVGCQNTVIPNTVSTIGERAFGNCYSLTSVTIPNSVTTICESAFSYCSGLTSVFISESVYSIGLSAFDGTPWYNNQPDGLVYAGLVAYKYKGQMPTGTDIVLKDNTKGIASSCFSNCSGLLSVTIPEMVIEIGNSAFAGCSSLKKATIGNAITLIGSSAFSGCSNLNDVSLGNSVTKIGNNAFYNCSGLTSVNIPETVVSIGGNAFSGCIGLTSVVWGAKTCNDFESYSSPFYNITSIKSFEFGDNVEDIPNYLCCGLTGLTSVIIPESVISIGNSAFDGCSGLTSATIGNSVTSIGQNAFSNCTGLTSVTIGESVTAIGSFTFNGCDILSSVVWNAKNCVSVDRYTGPFNNKISIQSFEFGDAVECIPSNLCYGLTALKSILIPNSVKVINENAFYACRGLTSVTLGNSVTSIGSYAFGVCSNVTEINIPSSITSIDKYAFYNCSGLKAVNINDIANWCQINFEDKMSNPLYYAHHLYLDAKDVTKLEIPQSVTSIGNYAFCGLRGMLSVTIPEDVSSIGDYAFGDCIDITSIFSYVNPAEATLGNYVFLGVNKQKCVLTYRYQFDDAYRTMDQWKDFNNISYIFDNPVTSITLNKNETTIYYHGQEQLIAGVLPNNADLKTLQWTSENEDIAIVDPNGMITAQALGSTIISAVATDNSGISATCRVTVKGAEDFALSDGELKMYVTDTYKLSATFTPSDLVYKTLNWTSSDVGVATVDGEGTITAHSAGTATITATTTDGTNISRTCQLTAIPKYSLTAGEIEHMRGDKEETILLPVSLDNLTEVAQLQFDFTLPDGVEIVGEYIPSTGMTYYDDCIQLANDRKTRSHYATINRLNSSTYHVLISTSQGNMALKGNHGIVAHIVLSVAKYHNAGDYYIKFSNIVMNGTDVADQNTAPTYNSLVRFKYKLGDANADIDVDVADYQATARYILRLYTPHFYTDAANVNDDLSINVSDLQGIVNIMAGIDPATIKYTPKRSAAISQLSYEPTIQDNGDIAIRLQGMVAVGAMQMDLTLPPGATLVNAATTMNHQVEFAKQADSTYRLVIGSPSGAVFLPSEEAFLLLKVNGVHGGTVLIHDAIAVERDLTTHQLDNVEFDLTPSGTNSPTVDGDYIYVDNNRLVIQSQMDGIAQLVRVNGATSPLTIRRGRNEFVLYAGIYIVKIGNTIAKIQIK